MTMKALESLDQTLTFSCLLTMLRESIPQGNDKATGVNQPLVDNIVNGLIASTKLLSSNIKRLDIDTVLYGIHLFFEAHPPTTWRGQKDLPLRAAKTILSELVKCKGENIRNHLSRIPVDAYPIIISYLELLIKQEETKAAGGVHASSSSSSTATSSTPTTSRIALTPNRTRTPIRSHATPSSSSSSSPSTQEDSWGSPSSSFSSPLLPSLFPACC